MDAEADAVELMQRVMQHEVFEEPEDLAMNVAQGNRSPQRSTCYFHLDMDSPEAALAEVAGRRRRAIVVPTASFSMRGDHAPLGPIAALSRPVT